MVKEIGIYIEGGGDSSATKTKLRDGFHHFFGSLIRIARDNRVQWKIIMCGGNKATFDTYRSAIQKYHESFLILLVDSDGPVGKKNSPWTYFAQKFNEIFPKLPDKNAHLFVQTMETWLISDIEALHSYYGAGFNAKAIPNTNDPEKIPKDRLVPSLERASRSTQKGEYQKIDHAAELLKKIDPNRARVAHWCGRLFTTIESWLVEQSQ
jgi:hypothetical protein